VVVHKVVEEGRAEAGRTAVEVVEWVEVEDKG
jgi:hypothetical protein